MTKYLLISLLFFAACNKSCFDSNSTQMKYKYQLLQSETKNRNERGISSNK